MRKQRIGIILDSLGSKNTPALRFAILRLNQLQSFAEFEIVYQFPPDHNFIRLGKSKATIERSSLTEVARCFQEEVERLVASPFQGARANKICDRYLAICNCSIKSNFYLLTTDTKLRILAIGGWERNMAPPSLLEFIVFNTLKQGIRAAFANPDGHLASRGCLFDFNKNLENARNAVLIGYICSECEEILSKNSKHDIAEIKSILGGKWLGDPKDPLSTFSELQRLGFQPFQASGVEDTWWSKLVGGASDSFVKEIAKYVALAVVLIIAIRLGFTPLLDKM